MDWGYEGSFVQKLIGMFLQHFICFTQKCFAIVINCNTKLGFVRLLRKFHFVTNTFFLFSCSLLSISHLKLLTELSYWSTPPYNNYLLHNTPHVPFGLPHTRPQYQFCQKRISTLNCSSLFQSIPDAATPFRIFGAKSLGFEPYGHLLHTPSGSCKSQVAVQIYFISKTESAPFTDCSALKQIT